VPPPAIGDLRDLTRTRTQLVRESSRHTQRIQKVLEDAHLKLTEVLSDILGASGRAILAALVAGERDPERLAVLTQGRLKASRAELVAALHGRLTDHDVFLLKLHLNQVDTLERAVAHSARCTCGGGAVARHGGLAARESGDDHQTAGDWRPAIRGGVASGGGVEVNGSTTGLEFTRLPQDGLIPILTACLPETPHYPRALEAFAEGVAL
jgi:hypothetical protein